MGEIEQAQIRTAEEILEGLRNAVIGGKSWYLALLEAINEWTIPEESYNGRQYVYLIEGEAFDWLTLAERLSQTVADLIPHKELEGLLFRSKAPVELSVEDFKKLIGAGKYKQYLNYFYGVTVEQALILAVENEVRKERRASGLQESADITNEAFRRIYGSSRGVMLNRFRKEKGYCQRKATTLSELEEFAYWLFKYRFKYSEPARVASDTKKGLRWLECNGQQRPG